MKRRSDRRPEPVVRFRERSAFLLLRCQSRTWTLSVRLGGGAPLARHRRALAGSPSSLAVSPSSARRLAVLRTAYRHRASRAATGPVRASPSSRTRIGRHHGFARGSPGRTPRTLSLAGTLPSLPMTAHLSPFLRSEELGARPVLRTGRRALFRRARLRHARLHEARYAVFASGDDPWRYALRAIADRASDVAPADPPAASSRPRLRRTFACSPNCNCISRRPRLAVLRTASPTRAYRYAASLSPAASWEMNSTAPAPSCSVPSPAPLIEVSTPIPPSRRSAPCSSMRSRKRPRSHSRPDMNETGLSRSFPIASAPMPVPMVSLATGIGGLTTRFLT